MPERLRISRKGCSDILLDKSEKEIQMCRVTEQIDYKLAGNELVAFLMESSAIKHYFPLYNRAQKRKIPAYAIFHYEDRDGILHLAFNKVRIYRNRLPPCIRSLNAGNSSK